MGGLGDGGGGADLGGVVLGFAACLEGEGGGDCCREGDEEGGSDHGGGGKGDVERVLVLVLVLCSPDIRRDKDGLIYSDGLPLSSGCRPCPIYLATRCATDWCASPESRRQLPVLPVYVACHRLVFLQGPTVAIDSRKTGRWEASCARSSLSHLQPRAVAQGRSRLRNVTLRRAGSMAWRRQMIRSGELLPAWSVPGLYNPRIQAA